MNGLYPSDDLLIAGITSVGASLKPGEFEIQGWREAGLLHRSFVKRALTTIEQTLVRKRLGLLEQNDLRSLDGALRLWLNL